ncbi:MAG: hypothetical protein KJ907_13605 [Actinobacteria bacterium]|nr:hypothetical protein [Actinomycetota bacterium]MBU4403753.1 hypothetical protein [Actinomycetota bacterium]MCG2819320.1 hypothetical protein [Actinomycetes bacterium]
MEKTSESHVLDLQGLVEENINSYKAKVESITSFMEEAAGIVQRISAEQDELASTLRDMLAKSQCLRKKDFDDLYCPVKEKRRQDYEKVTGAIDVFRRGEYEMTTRWQSFISGEDGLTLSDFYSNKEEMLSEHECREEEVIRAIRNYHLQQEELLAGLRGLVGKGDNVRIADLRVILRNMDARVSERETDMGGLLEEIWEAARVVREDWHGIMSARGH